MKLLNTLGQDLWKKEQLDIFYKQIRLRFSNKVSKIILQEDRCLDWIFEWLIWELIWKTGEKLLWELAIVKVVIEENNLFSNEEYRKFIRYLFSKWIISNENFQSCTMIFEWQITEVDRVLIVN